ncbi:glycoside hydrolase family 32 protein [Paenibacillus sedimenti]|uniref:glycoside hydrolase family 32 protein n=1 Tax=Paenibacillus sedimenti TaxID=2770274 RepID=UPI002896B3E3|nr:glycoside hydrolase family 32 protein [Paenibacillus sedimenti]
MNQQDNKSVRRIHAERVLQANKALGQLAAGLTDESFRLRYHLMPPAGWMNDPNGLVHYKGEYHAFYQHYPYEPRWGPMHWGHAKSKDLIHWEHLPIALAPSEPYDLGESGGYGCWSGSAIDHDGKLTLFYTGHVDGRTPMEVQCMATSSDGVSFVKNENPVISAPPEEGGFGFRDPKVWMHEGSWYLVMGYGKDGLGKALLYKADDLRDWTYIGIAAESDGTMGDMWECPDLFPLGNQNKHVLIISPMNMGATKTMYMSGRMDYERGQFIAEQAERLDYGFDFYAPQTFKDANGRRILLGWMNIWGATMPEQDHGWMGAFTLPRELKLAADGTLLMEPVAELTSLRGTHRRLELMDISADTVVPLPDIAGDALEMNAVFDIADASGVAEFGFWLRCSDDDAERTEVAYSMTERKLSMDRSLSGIGDSGVSEVRLNPMEDGCLKLHMFIDRSSVELFANNGIKTITNRIYPDPASVGIRLFSKKGNAKLVSLDVWDLASSR